MIPVIVTSKTYLEINLKNILCKITILEIKNIERIEQVTK